MPRMPISVTPPLLERAPLQFSDELILQLAAVWREDLAVLKTDLAELRRELRPWYVRLWEWMRGR
jgi:hypothetical protein